MSKNLKFWGTRGSCPVSGPEYAKFGGNTTCLEIRYGDANLIIDAGTGIRPLGNALLEENKHGSIQLFLSHTHWDHIIGFPFFAPLYSHDAEISIWSPAEHKRNGRQIFEQLLNSDFFPVRLDELKAKLHFHPAHQNTSVKVGSVTLHFCQVHHPSIAYGFKIQTPHQTIGYASDNELFHGYQGELKNTPDDDGLVSFFSGCDILIHEAQYFPDEYRKKAGWGHSSVINAAALVQKAKITRWLVVHHDPKHTDADLDRLAALGQRILDENDISCRAEWVGDGHMLALD